VNRWGIPGSPTPFIVKGITGYCFVLEGQLTALQDLCDRYLNQPSGGAVEYRPLSQYVLLSFVDVQSLSCEKPNYRHIGWTPEHEVAFWVPTAAISRIRGVPVAERLVWFIPYMFVDSPPAIQLGREIHGFPKEYAWIDMPNHTSSPQRFSVDAFAVRQFSPQSRIARLKMLKVEADSPYQPGDRRGGTMWTTSEAAVRGIADLLSRRGPLTSHGLRVAPSVLAGLLRWEVTMVCLKQTYHPANGEYADYMAIVEAPGHATAFRRLTLLPGEHRFCLYPCQSHPIADDLGLQQEMRAVAAFHADYDVILGNGQTMWASGEPQLQR